MIDCDKWIIYKHNFQANKKSLSHNKLIHSSQTKSMQFLTQLRFNLFRKSRQATFHKQPFYPAIPHFYKPNFIDIHDTYTKRSLEEVKEEFKGKQFDIIYQRAIYNPSDYHKEQKQQKAIAILDYKQFNFTQLQFERFKVLVGPRLKPGKTQVKFSCHIFDNFEANFEKLNEQIYEVLMQSKRAP